MKQRHCPAALLVLAVVLVAGVAAGEADGEHYALLDVTTSDPAVGVTVHEESNRVYYLAGATLRSVALPNGGDEQIHKTAITTGPDSRMCTGPGYLMWSSFTGGVTSFHAYNISDGSVTTPMASVSSSVPAPMACADQPMVWTNVTRELLLGDGSSVGSLPQGAEQGVSHVDNVDITAMAAVHSGLGSTYRVFLARWDRGTNTASLSTIVPGSTTEERVCVEQMPSEPIIGLSVMMAEDYAQQEYRLVAHTATSVDQYRFPSGSGFVTCNTTAGPFQGPGTSVYGSAGAHGPALTEPTTRGAFWLYSTSYGGIEVVTWPGCGNGWTELSQDEFCDGYGSSLCDPTCSRFDDPRECQVLDDVPPDQSDALLELCGDRLEYRFAVPQFSLNNATSLAFLQQLADSMRLEIDEQTSAGWSGSPDPSLLCIGALTDFVCSNLLRQCPDQTLYGSHDGPYLPPCQSLCDRVVSECPNTAAVLTSITPCAQWPDQTVSNCTRPIPRPDGVDDIPDAAAALSANMLTVLVLPTLLAILAFARAMPAM